MASDFVTKDSGERAVFESGMQRDTQEGKPRFDLCLPEGIPYEDQLLTRFAALMARGAAKYTERNWEQANSLAEIARMKASALRHFMQWYHGEVDEDHAAAVLFNIMAAEATTHKLEAACEQVPQRYALGMKPAVRTVYELPFDLPTPFLDALDDVVDVAARFVAGPFGTEDTVDEARTPAQLISDRLYNHQG